LQGKIPKELRKYVRIFVDEQKLSFMGGFKDTTNKKKIQLSGTSISGQLVRGATREVDTFNSLHIRFHLLLWIELHQSFPI
jgi:hypothetical protein